MALPCLSFAELVLAACVFSLSRDSPLPHVTLVASHDRVRLRYESLGTQHVLRALMY